MNRYLSGSAKRKKKALIDSENKKLSGTLNKYFLASKNIETAEKEEEIVKAVSECLDSTIKVVESELSSSNVRNLKTISNDPAFWDKDQLEKLQEHFCQVKPSQNIEYLQESARVTAGKERKLSEKHFFSRKQNNELIAREWLIYSPEKRALFCYICMLFSTSEQALTKQGFTDWKNIHQRLSEHERSGVHRVAVCLFSNRCIASARIDNKLVEEYELECKYWQNVLRRVVAVVKHLCQRGLPFFGSDETLHSAQNGNFLASLELISLFDPFLSEHLVKYGNPGSGKTNYLSSTIVNEFIDIMSDSVMKKILLDVSSAKYFGLIVDSTPDLSHIDQLSVIVRYVNEHGSPVERFVKFLPMQSHTSSSLCDIILNLFHSLNIDMKNCRGQSYDNASNMAGKYSGLQARIKAASPFAEYVPCSSHSLNLVGSISVECCYQVVTFFDFVQNLYNFFSASTHRWRILTEKLSEISGSKFTLKNLSSTRWSARSDAVKALKIGYVKVMLALELLSNDTNEKVSTRHEAASLLSKMRKLETAIFTFVWDAILQRINKVNKTLQDPTCSLSVVVPLYEMLIEFIQQVRETFHIYESDAQQIVSETYVSKRKRKAAKSRMLDESSSDEAQFDDRDSFIYCCHYVLCDSLMSELNKRKDAYACLEETFGFLYKEFNNETKNDIYSAAKKFQGKYSADIGSDFPDEYIQFKSFLAGNGNGDYDLEKQLKTLKKLKIEHTFPNVDTCLRILLSMPISNASSERSFSALKRIKNSYRCQLSQHKLNSLTLLAVENDITSKLDFEDVIVHFAQIRSRRKPL